MTGFDFKEQSLLPGMWNSSLSYSEVKAGSGSQKIRALGIRAMWGGQERSPEVVVGDSMAGLRGGMQFGGDTWSKVCPEGA